MGLTNGTDATSIASLTAKYREERDKRLRDEGIYQYRDVTESSLKHYAEDPWSNPIEWDSIREDVHFAILGGGFGGLLLAARLFEVGMHDIKIIDKAGDFGGTWYYNRYPGVGCDTESYIYIPLLEEVGHVPSEKYASGAEIFEHARKIGQKYDLYNKALFQTEVYEMEWNDSEKRWILKTARGDVIRAKFVATAGGPLHKPKLPGVPGIENFKGHSFHPSRWDYGYTGGSIQGNLTGFSDKRVGLIGTGATSVQMAPHLAQTAKQLCMFQRTPPAVDVRNNRLTDPKWAKSLGKGWQQKRMDNFTAIMGGGRVDEDRVNDGWTQIYRETLPSWDSEGDFQAAQRAAEEADYRLMEKIRQRVGSIVYDPKTAEALKSWYRRMCKRSCFHDSYLDIFNRPNVTLVDTDGKGIERITEKGIVANGKEIEPDLIIYATGFEYSLRGRGGITLANHFKDGIRTLHGFFARGFPNFFMLNIAQVGTMPNITQCLNNSAKHLAWVTKELTKRGASTVEVSAEAEESWVETVKELGKLREDFLRECTPDLFNNEGKVTAEATLGAPYALGPLAYNSVLEEWRAEADLPGLEIDGKLLTTKPAITRPSSD